MQVHRLPIGIISRIKRPPILIELVAEHKNVVFVIEVGGFDVGVLRCLCVDKAKVPEEDGDLAGGVDAAEVEPALRGLLDFGEMGDDRVSY